MTAGAPANTDDRRPILAILCSELPPYRIHFHRRVAREIPELSLRTILTRDSAWSAWKLPTIPELGLVATAEGTLAQLKTRSGRARFQLRNAADTVRWLNEHRPAAVLVNGYNELSRLRAIRWASARSVPVLLWGDANIRADHAAGLKRAIKNILVPRTLRRCDAVLACGSLGRAFFRRYGVPDDRIFYSPVEPDYQELESLDPALIDAARRRFSLNPARRRFVVSSRLVPHKRVEAAIDAFAAIAGERPEWDLVILGDGPERAALQQRTPAPLRDRVTFTGFVGEQSAVTAVYRLSHVLVHPAAFEPWALVINEAAAAGLAIVSTDVVGAAAELVRDGINGLLVPVDDAAAMRRAMLTASEQHARMGAASKVVLADWRRTGDPIRGLRRALAAHRVLPPEPTP